MEQYKFNKESFYEVSAFILLGILCLIIAGCLDVLDAIL